MAMGNPDRNSGADARLASDPMAVHLGFAKDGLPYFRTVDCGYRWGIQRPRRRFPTMAATFRKRDIGGAFDRMHIHRDISKLTMAELGDRLLGMGDLANASRLAFPFGRIDSPEYCQLFGTSDTDAPRI